MKNISIRSTLVLSILGVLAICIITLVENTKKIQQQEYYYEKIEAATLAKQCQLHIKNKFYEDEISLDNINDPNNSGIIGQQFSEITSGRGSLPIKLSTLNPNFAAMIVEQIKEAGLKKGDKVALCFTGSFPALNIATCAAIESLQLKPILITSVTSSSWGANNPNLTWLDMQKSLYEAKLISFLPIASSIGGNQDIGQTLSREGRELVISAIKKANIEYLNKGSLKANIEKRMELFNIHKDIKLFINVGGGIASLGSSANADAFPSGLKKDMKLKNIPEHRGVVFEMVKKDIPIINLLNIEKLLKEYKLPMDPMPLPEVGEGNMFQANKYDLKIVISLTSFYIVLIIFIMYYDKRQNELGTQIIKKYE